MYVALPEVWGVCCWGLGEGVGDGGKAPGMAGEGLAKGPLGGVEG